MSRSPGKTTRAPTQLDLKTNNTMKKLLTMLFAAVLLLLCAGCPTNPSNAGSAIPQARPAPWEGGIPGMGNPGDQR